MTTIRAVTGMETDALEHQDLCALLQRLYFDVTPDCSKIVTVVAGDEDVRGLIEEDECVRTFSPWSRDCFVPDYYRLTKGTYLSQEDAVKECVWSQLFLLLILY